MQDRWNGVEQVEQEWMAVVRDNELKQIEQSYVPALNSLVSRSSKVCETGAGAGGGAALLAAGFEEAAGGTNEVAAAFNAAPLVFDSAALNRALRELF